MLNACKHLFSRKSLLSLLILSFFSCSVFSAPATFTFIEFNLAFILGVSLPLLIIIVLIKPNTLISRRFPILLTINSLAIFYVLVFFTFDQKMLLLSLAMTFLCLIFYWPLTNFINKEHKLFTFTHRFVNTCAVLYLCIIWFIPSIDGYTLWGVVSALIMTLAAVHIQQVFKKVKSLAVRLIMQWLITACFIIALYLWVNSKLNINVLVISLVACYLIAMINGCWLVAQILSTKAVNIADTAKINRQTVTYPSDPATNLPTYQQALNYIDSALKKEDKIRCVAIVFKPINFQQVNNVLGHKNSDILLLQLAYYLQKELADKTALINFNSAETPVRIARLQGLHFLVVLDINASHHPERFVINDLCHQLAKAVPDAMSFKSFSLNFELSFGIAFIGEHGDSIAEVIAHAEDALLDAENNQQMLSYFDNKSVLYTEQRLREMETLKQDLVDEKLRWFLQPQVSLSNRRITGFELKVHWYNNNSPLELHQFIDTAEYSGEIYLLTKQMIKQAFLFLVRLKKLGNHQPVSIKLLSQYLLEPELINFIEKQIDEFGVPGSFLMIELTENIVLSASHRAKAMIDQLRSLKINIAISDFSGSYEALRYLRKMALNQVKIDCSHLGEGSSNYSDKAIVNALVNLTRAMKLPLIATGVNNEVIEKTFTAMGGEYAQGTVVNSGVVADELAIWLDKWHDRYGH
ncbi:MAG: EAL domain-containing protein (putative c-di-GMP-specific phosphodiesterase class I) [Alteromonadaceae bacterium]|jgi:EAL domain-containing protein (putative c-di-GMP-specific phosphodiesterase class I)/GGDEF domain-containing protein